MTVKEMRYILKGLPSSMQVVIPLSETKFLPLCRDHTEIIDADNHGHQEQMLLLNPCHCETDVKDLTENLPMN